ncbi:MAG TPA: hypothetical protein VGY54_13525 [Polyangiaceae bacterium]|jgi:hypothetical protein|nr:hypothetical protein [Polyangiaceae bacterium]
MQKHIRRGREFWAKVVAEFEDGGAVERHKAFAARHGVRCDSFQQWLYRFRREGPSLARDAPRADKGARAMPWPLVEVQSGRVSAGGFEIESPGGWRVRVPASFESEGLRRLLAIFDERHRH